MTSGAGSLSSPSVAPETLAAWARHMGDLSMGREEVRRRLGNGSLPSAFSATARTRANLPALTIGGITMTHGEVDDAAAVAGARIRSLGGGPGESVMLVADNGMAEAISYLGILRSGAAVVLANPTLTTAEMERMLSDSGARIVIGRGAGLRACVASRSPGVDEVVGLEEDDLAISTVLLSQIPAQPMEVVDIPSDSPAVLAYTSGTTGRPKCAPLSHRNLLASIRGAMWAWRWSRDDHLVHALPVSHQHGLSGIHATLLAGSRATILTRFDSDALLAQLSGGGGTVLFGVPAIHQRLLTHGRTELSTLGSLRLVTSGSAPLPVDVALEFEEVTGHRILERYGTTESGLDVSNPYEGERIPGSVGLPLPGVEIAVVDDTGQLVGTGDAGEILVRGPQVFTGYRGEVDDGFRGDWFRTGDDGVIDPGSGYLAIVGRRKEMIITGGMNVYPREVEDVIRESPDVVDVAVVGVPSERWGEEVVAFVTPATVDDAALSASIAGTLAPYKRPKWIHPVEELPLSSVGKIDRDQLIRQAVSPDGEPSPSSGI